MSLKMIIICASGWPGGVDLRMIINIRGRRHPRCRLHRYRRRQHFCRIHLYFFSCFIIHVMLPEIGMYHSTSGGGNQ